MQNGKKVVYLSGPMTGQPGLGFDVFAIWATRLRELGFEVINPAEFSAYEDDGVHTRAWYYKRDCDVIAKHEGIEVHAVMVPDITFEWSAGMKEEQRAMSKHHPGHMDVLLVGLPSHPDNAGVLSRLASVAEGTWEPPAEGTPVAIKLRFYEIDEKTAVRVGGIKDSGTRREFETGAVRDMGGGKGRYDLMPWLAIHLVAKLMEKGAIKYAARNWEKGIPLPVIADSAMRHGAKEISGMTDEDHAVSAAWNWLVYLQTREWIKQKQLPESLLNWDGRKVAEF